MSLDSVASFDFEAVYVFENETSKSCGHAWDLVHLLDYLESCGNKKTICPICEYQFTVVASDCENKNSPIIFKYRSHLFKLSKSNSLVLPFPLTALKYCVWIWQLILRFMGENTTVTIQERIAGALRINIEAMKVSAVVIAVVMMLYLEGDSSVFDQVLQSHSFMFYVFSRLCTQILYKGKVLYPHNDQSSRAISDQLMKVCSMGGKPLVMGTRMTERQHKIAAGKWVIRLYVSVLRVGLSKTISLVQGIMAPLIGGRHPAPIDHSHRY